MRLPTSSRYWSEAEGRAVIEAWRRSGEPRSAFAKRHGLQAKRLRYWAGRLSRAEKPARKLALVPATVVGAELAAVIRAGEVTIELSSATPEQVAMIAQALARSAS
jgi:transposase-like protein